VTVDLLVKKTSELSEFLQRHGVPASDSVAHKLLRGGGDPALSDVRNLALLMFDPVGIQALVLGSPRPITITGASHALWDWDERATSIACERGAWPVFVGGGLGVFLTGRDTAQALADALVRAFGEQLHGGLAGVAWREVSVRELAEGPDPWDDAPSEQDALTAYTLLRYDTARQGGFGRLLGELARRVSMVKDDLGRWQLEGHDGRRCSECGLRRAVGPARFSGTDRVCERCYAFHESGADRRRRKKEPRSFQDFKGGPVYIALDGAGVGAVLQELKTMGQYVVFSDALLRCFGEQSTRDMFRDLGLEDDEAPEDRRRRPYQLIVAGGDDLLVAVAADQEGSMAGGSGTWQGPVEFAVELGRLIERTWDAAIAPHAHMWGGQAPVLGVGIGVAVAGSISARLGFEMARQLVKSAKKRVKVKGGARSAIDFEYFPAGSIVATQISALRETRSRPAGRIGVHRDATLHLYRRPFALDPILDHLLRMARRLNPARGDSDATDVPLSRSQLYHVRQMLEGEPEHGLFVGACHLHRAVGAEGEVALRWAPALGTPWERADTLLVRYEGPSDDGQHHYSTAIPDLIDMMAVLRPRGGRS